MLLENKVIVITGSTRGSGKAIAEACAKEGASVVISSRKEQAVLEMTAALKNQGLKAAGIAADVSQTGDLEKLFQFAVKSFGKIDVWINNAGLSSGYRYLHDLSGQEIADIVSTNLTGLLDASRLILPYFIRQKGGILINMTGRGGRGEAAAYTTVYACTKAAIANLTKSLAIEYQKYPVSIHAVLPGMMPTDFYVDMKVSPDLEEAAKSVPLLLDAFGTPLDAVGRLFVKIAAQEPGKVTGKIYSAMSGLKMASGILKMIWYQLTGKVK